MNFLAHYAVGTLPNDPLYTLGCLLPDLVRNYRKGLRVKPTDSTEPSALELGVRHHYLADQIFHGSDFFKSMSQLFRVRLDQNGFRDRRYGFFTTHGVVELMLDRCLMRHDPTMIDRLYFNLDNLTELDTQRAFEAFGLPGFQDFYKFLQRFRSSRYLYGYQYPRGISFALSRIHQRVGLEPFDNQSFDWLVSMDATLRTAGLSTVSDIAEQIKLHA
jgi:hypothetical protein